MFVFRVSSAFVVMVLLTKSALFVADDAKFLEVESLGAIEKRVGKLIDEAMRDLSEEKEREEEGAHLAFAVRFVASRKAIMRCVDGVCDWVRDAAAWVSASVASPAVAVVSGYAARRHETDLRTQQIKPNPVALG